MSKTVEKIKVCHLTSAHPDGDIRIFHKECVSLVEAGFEVHIVVPNTTSRIEKGVHIHGIQAEAGGRINRMQKVAKQVYEEALKIDAAIYHFHDPELLSFGLKLQKKDKKVIYDAHEDVPRQILGKPWIPKMFRKIISLVFERYENRISSQLSFIVVSTPTIKDRFIQINSNCEAICNYPILNENTTIPDWDTRNNEICYVGGITVMRGIKELIDALEFTKNIRLNMAGSYSPLSLKNELKVLPAWEKVNEFGFVGRNEIVEILNQSKIGIVTLYPQPNYLESLPIKMFEYMLAGIPVIASDFPLWKQIVEGSDCGICVDPKNSKQIGESIMKILNDDQRAKEMGLNGRKVILEKYNWGIEAQKLISIYHQLAIQK